MIIKPYTEKYKEDVRFICLNSDGPCESDEKEKFFILNTFCDYFIEKEGETLPMSSKPEAIDAAQIAADLEVEYTEAFVNVISVDVDEYAKKHFEKAVKKTLTVPYWLNKLALEKNINFSQVLQDALKNELGIM